MAEETGKSKDDSAISGEFKTSTSGDAGEFTTGINISGEAANLLRQYATGPSTVSLQPSATQPTADQPLWVAIRHRTEAINFKRYRKFIDYVLCEEKGGDGKASSYSAPGISRQLETLTGRSTILGMDSYKLLKLATEAFLVFECGFLDHRGTEPLDFAEESRRLGYDVTREQLETDLAAYLSVDGDNRHILPYLRRIVDQIIGTDEDQQEERLPYCEAVLQHRLTCPSFIELIWSYWHEEGMLVQTVNAIALRFQNKQRGARDPLANLALDPLRPLNNLLWGFIQDESDRLTVQRRAYEYDHHYGISLVGKAVGEIHSVDSRTKFIEAFHNLLYRAVMFYREDDDNTIVADAFALLNSLREVHLILAANAHNQFGDLPWKARKEMLMMQWILARPEIREFYRGRHMVPYQEPWMGAVDDMRRLQGWSDVTITNFHELAVYGEQLLLSVRYGDWIDVNDQESARNWARYWRPEIQRYIHSYNAVTGVDLSLEITDTSSAGRRYVQPSSLIAARTERTSVERPVRAPDKRLRSAGQQEFDMHDITDFTLRRLPRK